MFHLNSSHLMQAHNCLSPRICLHMPFKLIPLAFCLHSTVCVQDQKAESTSNSSSTPTIQIYVQFRYNLCQPIIASYVNSGVNLFSFQPFHLKSREKRDMRDYSCLLYKSESQNIFAETQNPMKLATINQNTILMLVSSLFCHLQQVH